MKTILVVDAGRGQQRWGHAPAEAPGTRVICADGILAGRFDEMIVTDYGDEESARLVCHAVRYRAEHRGCRLSVVRVLKDEWDEVETVARALSSPTTTPGRNTLQMHAARFARPQDGGYSIRIDDDTVLLEYAA